MPSFGHAVRDWWMLDPAILYLNHGTVGAPPRRVLEAQQRIRDEIERQPSQFMLRELAELGRRGPGTGPPRMRVAAAQVAAFLGARGEDLAFVDNITTGANAVLRSLELRAGDEIVATDLGYGAITNAARYAARRAGATVRVLEMPYPVREPGDITAAILAGLAPATRVLVVDHISAESALVLPVQDIVAACRARGVQVLVDGAHVPGAMPLDIPSIGAHWYAANLHKWAWAPRSSGVLWAEPGLQPALHPTVISWGLDQGYTKEFDLLGTRDPSPWLAAPAAIELMRETGFEAICAWNHALAWEGAQRLARRWGTAFVTPERMVGTMATVPLPEAAGGTMEQAVALRAQLLSEDRIEVQMHAWRGRLHVRISAQIYNQMSDIDALGEAVARRVAG